VDYLALIREDYDRQLLEHVRPLAYIDLKPEPDFDAEHFVQVVTGLAGLRDRPTTHNELVTFFESYAPMPEELVRIAVEHVVRLHGRGRHPRVYLHAIRTLVVAQWQKPPNKEDNK
jgi:hypothetical protein